MATLNYQLYRSTPPEKYATMFLGCYDAALALADLFQRRTSASAGAGRQWTHRAAGNLGHSRGPVRRRRLTAKARSRMEPGDIFVAYSDGITEPENEFGEFGEERLIELIQRHRDQPLARISDIVTGAVTDWIAGGEQPDDMTLVLARAR